MEVVGLTSLFEKVFFELLYDKTIELLTEFHTYILVLVTVVVFTRMKPKFVWELSRQGKKNALYTVTYLRCGN